jgi:acyl-CoA thioesterase-2
MPTVLEDLVSLLALERIEEDLFRGQSQDLGWGTVFGGQVLGQALSAAAQTVPDDRHAHSLHAYFLRPGDVSRPVLYEVDRIRDGSSFTTRRVVAVQKGAAIFNLAASFQCDETGFEHHEPMPDAPPPESIPTEQERLAPFAQRLPRFLRGRALSERAFELRPIDAVECGFTSRFAATTGSCTSSTAPRPTAPAASRRELANTAQEGLASAGCQRSPATWVARAGGLSRPRPCRGLIYLVFCGRWRAGLRARRDRPSTSALRP